MNLKARISFIILIVSLAFLIKTNAVLAQSNNNNSIGTDIYLQNCASCHIPIPAEVLPTESWQDILNNTQNHYGTALPTSVKVNARLLWAYLRTSSRPANPGETLPQYVTNARYLKALHPQVDLPKPTTHQTCQLCHPSAAKLDYRTLSPDFSDGSK